VKENAFSGKFSSETFTCGNVAFDALLNTALI